MEILTLIIFLIVGSISFMAGFYTKKKMIAKEIEEEMKSNHDLVILEKEARKRKIMEFFGTFLNREATNNDIEELLGVSDITAICYLNELRKEGKIKKIGKIGASIHYKKIPL